MQQLGLAPPSARPQQINFGGVMSAKPLSALMAEEAMTANAAAPADNAMVIDGLAGYIQRHWSLAKQAKLDIEHEMIEAVRARSGRYSIEKEREFKAQGGSQIYMMLFATKARQAKALLTDVLIGAGTSKPWTISPSPKPDIPPERVSQVVQGIQQMVADAEMSGMPMSTDIIRELMQDARDRLEAQVLEIARREAEQAEIAVEDCMVEGGFREAMDEFLDDLTTFKSAFIKGPVIQKESVLKWVPGPSGKSVAQVTEVMKMKWSRVDPFMMYPASWSKTVDSAYLLERHRLSRGDLSAMIGVAGYNDANIREVLQAHGTGGLRQWLSIDMEKESAEGRSNVSTESETIDALQYWGSVSGQMLKDWGMTSVTDTAKEYQVECWLIGGWVIKAIINPDPLSRRPYYSDGYHRIPGAFWHNSLYDLIQDCVNMCNAAARALANNLGIASGPQVGINIDRLAPGEEVSEMTPWKIWQFNQDPTGSMAKPIEFFQPTSNASELMGVYDKFSLMADEYSGIPRYMTGTEGTPGAGRTASGLSMMVGNASKVIKSLVSSTDIHVTEKAVKRTFDFKMQHDPEFDYSGDLQIVARGALSLTVKEAAQMARTQFLQQTANPIDMEIVGIDGRAAVLRETAKALDMDTDKVVPPLSVMKAKAAMAQRAQQQMLLAQQQAMGPDAQPTVGPQSGQTLQNGAPMADQFSPQPTNNP